MIEHPRILLVEDEPMIQELINTILQEADFTVTAVSDGETALQCLAASTYDLLVTDFMLPGMTGGAVITSLQGTFPALPTILISVLPNLAELAAEYKASAWCQKTDIFRLVPLIAQCLAAVSSS